MKQCDVCGNRDFHDASVQEVFHIGSQMVLVENIPAVVCDRCGEATFSRETVEKIRRMVHGEKCPDRKINVDVFAYA